MQKHQELRRRFSDAHDRHADEIFRFFAYRLADRERAKELAQDTFMRAWTYAANGNAIRELRPFLFKTASNLFKNELRDRKATISLEALMDATAFEPTSEEASPEERAEAALVLKSLNDLPDAEREVLTLRYLDGLTSREIAEMLGETETAVAVRTHRALKKLREMHTLYPHHER